MMSLRRPRRLLGAVGRYNSHVVMTARDVDTRTLLLDGQCVVLQSDETWRHLVRGELLDGASVALRDVAASWLVSRARPSIREKNRRRTACGTPRGGPKDG